MSKIDLDKIDLDVRDILTPVSQKKSYSLMLVAIVFVFFCTGIIASQGVSNLTIIPRSIAQLVISGTQFSLTIAFAIWLLHFNGYKKILPQLSLHLFNSPIVLYGYILILLAGAVLEPVLSMLPQEGIERVYKTIGNGGFAMLTSVIVIPILEEVLFRGVIQSSAEEYYGSLKAVLISSLVFGLVHIVPQQIIYAFVVGIILGYVYWRTKSILAVIVIHAMNNGMAFIQKILSAGDVDYFTLRGLIADDRVYKITYLIIVVIFILAFTSIILEFIWSARRRNKTLRV